jgi:hypothetical protein
VILLLKINNSWQRKYIRVTGPLELLENIIYGFSTVFALVLLGLSVTAYRNLRIKTIKYAIVAFALFSIYLFYEFIEDIYEQVDTPYNDVAYSALTFGVALFFFLAIVKKPK